MKLFEGRINKRNSNPRTPNARWTQKVTATSDAMDLGKGGLKKAKCSCRSGIGRELGQAQFATQIAGASIGDFDDQLLHQSRRSDAEQGARHVLELANQELKDRNARAKAKAT